MSTSKPKSREPLNTRQRAILMAFYNQNPYPSASERQELVQLTGRTLKQIQDWFSNRRRNDPKLISTPSTSTTIPPPIPIQPMYSYPPTATFCPCCCFTMPSSSIVNQSFYYPPY